MLIGFIPNLTLIFAFRPPISVPRLKHAYASYSNLHKVSKKKKRIFDSLIAHILGMAEGIFFKFGLPCEFDAIWIRHHRATDV